MLKKKCLRCGIEKEINEFSMDKCKKDGLCSYCKDCQKDLAKGYYKNRAEKAKSYGKKYYQENKEQCKEYGKKYCQENKEKIAMRNKAYRAKNGDKIAEYLLKNKERIAINHKVYLKKHYLENLDKYKKWNRDWRINNKDKKNEAEYRRRNNNPEVSLSHLISGYMLRSLGSNKNGMHWEDIVGYTLKNLMQYLESQFVNGMTWGNRGLYGWHVHHKIPVSLWKFESYTDREFKQCWALCNLQPLWAKDNLSIHNKVLPQIQRDIV